MMRVRTDFSIKGDKELIAGLRKLRREAPQEIDKMLFGGANETRNYAIKNIQTKKPSGRFIKRRTVRHEVSPAGGFPNTDRGTLVKNITVEKITGGYDVGSRGGAPHGFWLEFKEPSAGGRKWLEPSFMKGIQKVKELVARFR